jgi:hypothetical protein
VQTSAPLQVRGATLPVQVAVASGSESAAAALRP